LIKDTLKCIGWYPKLMHVLAILIILRKYLSSLIITLRYFHKIWPRSRENKLLQLWMAFLNSFLKKDSYFMIDFNGISSKRLRSI